MGFMWPALKSAQDSQSHLATLSPQGQTLSPQATSLVSLLFQIQVMLEGALETWIMLLAFSEAGWQVLKSQRTS